MFTTSAVDTVSQSNRSGKSKLRLAWPLSAPVGGSARGTSVMSGRVLFEWPKRGGVSVRVTIAEFNGSRFLDVREWVDPRRPAACHP